MVVSTDRINSVITEMDELLNKMPMQFERLKKERSLCDQELSDLDHLLEFKKMNASEGYRISRDRQITLLKRREIKDELFTMESIMNSIKSKRTLTEQTKSLSMSLNQLEKNRDTRLYNPRVRKDLNITGNHKKWSE